MIMVDPDPGWFKIFKAPCFKLEEEEKGNIEYIEKSSSRIIQIFNYTWL